MENSMKLETLELLDQQKSFLINLINQKIIKNKLFFSSLYLQQQKILVQKLIQILKI